MHIKIDVIHDRACMTFFRCVHGDIRPAHQRVRVIAVFRAINDAGAGVDDKVLFFHVEWFLQACQQALRQYLRFFTIFKPVEQHGKFVAAKPRDGVATTQAVAQTRCHLCQKDVTDVMPEGIVDFLETVQVQQQECECSPGA